MIAWLATSALFYLVYTIGRVVGIQQERRRKALPVPKLGLERLLDKPRDSP